MWRRGTTSTCSGAAGWMSLKATVVSVSCTISDGTSPATILQKRQSVMSVMLPVIAPPLADCLTRLTA